MNVIPSSSLPLVRLDRVSVAFGANLVLSNLSLQIRAGEHLVLLGPNGAGKSTLLRLLQGELRPALFQSSAKAEAVQAALPFRDPGKIYWAFDGHAESSALAAREHVRLVSSAQQSNYVRRGWNITGEEILLSGLDNAAMIYGEMSSAHYALAAELAEAARCTELLSMHAPAMSQGQLRLMLILRALMSWPRLLLLDEPFDGLDLAARDSVMEAIALAAKRGSTLIVSAHREEDVPQFIQKALLIKNGGVLVLDAVPVDAALENLLPVQGLPGPELLLTPPCPGGDDSAFLKAARSGQSPLFSLSHVDVFIDRRQVLFDISWTMRRGEQWIVSGPNGSGKSTLLRLLYGEEFAAFGGEFSWYGGLRPSLEELHAGVGYVSDRLQHTYEYDLTAEEVVVSGLRGSIGLYGEVDEKERSLAVFWLERLGVKSFAATPLHDLSSGTARKVLLARALAGSPPVLLLDEPCSGLDAPSRVLFLEALPLLVSQGVSIIYVSHHDEDKASFFTHELRLADGKVKSQGEIRL